MASALAPDMPRRCPKCRPGRQCAYHHMLYMRRWRAQQRAADLSRRAAISQAKRALEVTA